MKAALEASMSAIDLTMIRTEIIAAVSDDPTLREQLVLKGGNALALIHKIGMRTSLDIDYSMSDDLAQPHEFGMTMERALRSRFEPHGLVVFDFTFEPRPKSASAAANWGGYNAEFKLATNETESASSDLNQMRRQALTIDDDPQGSRRFRIEISKFEFCSDQQEVTVTGDVVCRVYSLDLVAAEKLRSLCQQMEEYGRRRHPTPRSRDFYDLHAVMTEGGVDLAHPDLHALVRASFVQKEVPLTLLAALDRYVEFHERDWDQVLNAIPAGKRMPRYRHPRQQQNRCQFMQPQRARSCSPSASHQRSLTPSPDRSKPSPRRPSPTRDPVSRSRSNN